MLPIGLSKRLRCSAVAAQQNPPRARHATPAARGAARGEDGESRTTEPTELFFTSVRNKEGRVCFFLYNLSAIFLLTKAVAGLPAFHRNLFGVSAWEDGASLSWSTGGACSPAWAKRKNP